jgi:hypothetical protein
MPPRIERTYTGALGAIFGRRDYNALHLLEELAKLRKEHAYFRKKWVLANTKQPKEAEDLHVLLEKWEKTTVVRHYQRNQMTADMRRGRELVDTLRSLHDSLMASLDESARVQQSKIRALSTSELLTASYGNQTVHEKFNATQSKVKVKTKGDPDDRAREEERQIEIPVTTTWSLCFIDQTITAVLQPDETAALTSARPTLDGLITLLVVIRRHARINCCSTDGGRSGYAVGDAVVGAARCLVGSPHIHVNNHEQCNVVIDTQRHRIYFGSFTRHN